MNGRIPIAAAVLAALLAPTTPAAVAAQTGPHGRGDGGWTLATDEYTAADYERQPYVGNGWLSQRIPATGAGYQGGLGETGWPLYDERYTGAFAAGFYHRDGQDEFLAALPTWSTLTPSIGGQELKPATAADEVSSYVQRLDLRGAVVSTGYTWTPAKGRSLRVAYDVLAHRERQHVGVVRMKLTPSFTGRVDVTGMFDGAGARRVTGVDRRGGEVTVRAAGTQDEITEHAKIAAGAGTKFADRKPVLPEGDATSAGERVSLNVQAGRTYEVVKYVGVAPEADEARSQAASAARAGWWRLQAEHRLAWVKLWALDVRVPDAKMQAAVNSSRYQLYSSIRAGQDHSLGPAGLSSDTYAGQVYWDADTWMFPTLLATHPELAKSVVDYRYKTLKQAKANAKDAGYAGGVWPWTAGPSGLCSGVGPCKGYQDHLQSEIALAQWQYYAATGDRQWLKERGWPVIKAIAEFWASRATKDRDGKYHVRGVDGADEYARDVDDHALTNGGTVIVLKHAITAAGIVGEQAPAAWGEIAENMHMPLDANGSHPEYEGYQGQKIKQADTVLLTYPYNYVTDPKSAKADLDRYAPVTDPDGPAMTDSVHAIIAAQVDAPGCEVDQYLKRSWEPFVREPFLDFSEARGDKAGDNAGAPAFSFLTGAGGFLQTIPYGLAGLRWDTQRLRLDPMLPPSLNKGATVQTIRWQGRTLQVTITRHTTHVRLVEGHPLTVALPDGDKQLRPGPGVITNTRTPSDGTCR